MTTSRRDFLKAATAVPAVLSFGSAAPALLRAAAADPTSDSDRVLVVVQLAGGNDGLNTVVPYDNDEYGRGRKTLRLTKREVLPISSDLGLHPEMTACRKLFDDGRLAFVQGTGYPHPSGDHGGSMRIWQTARLDAEVHQTGWLGQTVDALDDRTSAGGAFVGSIPRPLTINAARSVVSHVRRIESWQLPSEEEPVTQGGRDMPALLAEVARRTQLAKSHAARVEEVVRSSPRREYPDTPLGANLRIVAQLIEANVGVRIFNTELGGPPPGGFDNHAGQKDNHAALLHQLSEAVGAFVADLRRHGLLDRVVLVTFSEFGRTIAENGRRGTGHGSAAPMLLVGGKIRPGLIGDHPDMTQLENGGPKHHTDFRRVYATLLDEWLGINSQEVLGETFQPVGLFG